MNRKVFFVMVLVALGALSTPPSGAYAQSNNENEVVVRPRYQTEEEKAAELGMGIAGTGAYVWECHDEAAHTAGPPSTSRFPAEYEQTRGVLYGWPSYGCSMPELTELIRNSIGNVETTVKVPAATRPGAETCLRNRGFTDDDLARINWWIVPLNIPQSPRSFDIWIRDYGPEVLEAEDGSSQFIDLGYYSGRAGSCAGPFPGRPNSDVSPTNFAPDFQGGVAVFRPALRTEGGNIATDGAGTCLHMQREVLARNRFDRWWYTQEELDAVYTQYLNCPTVISLESLQPYPNARFGSTRVIDHIDMTMTFLSATKVLLGSYDPADDAPNAAILDRHEQVLTDAGYTVVRIPMPKPYCTVHRTTTCVSSPGDARECSTEFDRVWATYANSIRVGNKMMVPVYRDVPESLSEVIAAQEAEALAIYQRELDAEFGPGAVEVVPIVSDRMIPCQGAVHCIAMTYK